MIRAGNSKWHFDDAGWLESRLVYIFVISISILPVIFLVNPPLTDLGGHLGRMAVQLDGGKSEYLSAWYSFKWGLIPNLGTDVIIQAIGPFLGLERSMRLLVVAIVAIQVSGYVYLSRVVHGRLSPTAIFALPLVYSFPFHYGFLNFLLSIGLATWAIGLWISLGSHGKITRRSAIFAVLACVLWVSHLVGWAVLLIYAGADELVRNRAKGLSLLQSATRSIIPTLSLLTPILFYISGMVGSSASEVSDYFFDVPRKLFFIFSVFRDRWMVWELGSAALIIFIMGWAYRSKKFDRHQSLALGALLLFGCFLLMPGKISGSDFSDMRLVPTLFATALIAFNPKQSNSRQWMLCLTVASIIFLIARTGGTMFSLHVADRDFQTKLTALNAVPSGENLLSFVVHPCEVDQFWKLDRRGHLPGYAIVRREAFSNDQWSRSGVQLLHISNPDAQPLIKDPSQWASTSGCSWLPPIRSVVEDIASEITYMWIIADGTDYEFHGWTKVEDVQGSAVYRRDELSTQLVGPVVTDKHIQHIANSPTKG